MDGYTILYRNSDKEILEIMNGRFDLTINQQTHSYVKYDDYAALIVGMDSLQLDYSGWCQYWIKNP